MFRICIGRSVGIRGGHLSFSTLFLKAEGSEIPGEKLHSARQAGTDNALPASSRTQAKKQKVSTNQDNNNPQTGLAKLSDEALAQAVILGDLSCYEQLYERYAGVAFSLARRIVWSPEIAEEVIQEVFLKLWQHPQSYDVSKAKFKTWLLSAVHHRGVDEVRRRQVRPQESLEEQEMSETGLQVSGGIDPEEAAISTLQRESIRQALATLPSYQRQVVELAYFGGLTQREIAEYLSKPLGTVKTWLRQALFKLRDSLGLWQDAFTEP